MARTYDTWLVRNDQWVEVDDYLGLDVLVKGTNKYLNFGSVSGATGYGFRDNAGSMQFKNSGGSWTDFGTLTTTSADLYYARLDGTNMPFTGNVTITKGGAILTVNDTNDGVFPNPTAIPKILLQEQGVTKWNISSSSGVLSFCNTALLNCLSINQTNGRITVAETITVNGLNASQLVATDGSKNLQSLSTSTYPSLTEISYIKGLTSAVQTQLDARLKLDQSTPQTITASPILNWGTSTRVPYYNTDKTLTDSANFTFASNVLSIGTGTQRTQLGVTSIATTAINGANVTAFNITNAVSATASSINLIGGANVASSVSIKATSATGVGNEYVSILTGANGAVQSAKFSSLFNDFNTGTAHRFSIGGTQELLLSASALYPFTDASGLTLGTATNRWGTIYTGAVAPDYLWVSGASYNLDSRSHLTAKNGRLGIIDNANTFSQIYGRARLDILETAQQTVVIDSLSQPSTAVIEGYDGDRARTLLINRFGYTNSGGSSSSVIHWGEYYKTGDVEPYITHGLRSGWEMGNDLYLGIVTGDPYYILDSHNFYLWDSVRGHAKLFFTDNIWDSYMYEDDFYQQNYRIFRTEMNGDGVCFLYWGREAGEGAEDSTYGPSIYIGNKTGYSLGGGGSNLKIGNNIFGVSNGSGQTIYGHNTGTILDTNYEIAIGNAVASYGTNSGGRKILIGQGGNYDYAEGRVIIDPHNRSNATSTAQNALIRGTASTTGATAQDIRFNVATFEINGGNGDITLNFGVSGVATNVGQFLWKEDEDYFQFSDDILMTTTERHLFRDTAIGIYSQADTYLDLFADGAVRIGDSSAGAPTNYTRFAPDGELTQFGTARTMKEFQLTATSFSPGSSGALEVNVGNYHGWSFGINDDIVMNFEIPHDWDSSTNLQIFIYWAINEAYATNNGEVQWRIRWSATPPSSTEAISAPTHTGTIDFGDQNIPATAYYLTESAGGSIASSSLSAGDLIGITLDRVALDGGNNPVAEPIIFHIEVHYISNKLGEAT